MARDLIQVQYTLLDHESKVANICIEKTSINPTNGITIEEAFSCKYNSLFIVIENLGEQSLLIAKTVDSTSEDINIELAQGTSVIRLYDLLRFKKDDESIDLDFAENFTGTIYAIAKSYM